MAFQQYPSQLLRCTSLQEGEYLLSLIARLELLNGYETRVHIFEAYRNKGANKFEGEFNIWNPTQVASYARLSELTQIEVNKLYDATYHKFSETLVPPGMQLKILSLPGREDLPCIVNKPYQYFRYENSVTWCPHCLAEAPYQRLIWMAKSVSVCLKHMCLLNIGCPICRRPLSISEIVVRCCSKCQTDLITIPAHPIDSSDHHGLRSQKILQDWLSGNNQADNYSGLPYHAKRVLYHFIYGLQCSLDSVPPDWPFFHETSVHVPPYPYATSKAYKCPEDAYIRHATVCKSIMNWPFGFYNFLDAYCERNTPKRPESLIGQLGVIYSHWIEKNWQDPVFQFAQEAFDQYIIDHHISIPTVIRSSRYQANAALYKEFAYITVAEAARLLRVGSITIKQLIATGRLILAPNNQARDYPAIFIRRAEVTELRQRWNERVTLVETADLLGLSQNVTLDLVKINMLVAERGPSVDGSSQWWFLRSQVSTCLERVAKRAQNSTRRVSGFVDLSSAARMVAVVGMNAAQILQCVAEGRIHAYSLDGHGTGLEQLRFEAHDIRVCIDLIKGKQNWLNKKEMARWLGVKVTTLQRWISTGWLTPVIAIGNVLYYNRETLETFKARYITTNEAADLLGLMPLTIQTWARQGRLTPMSGPEIDGSHNYRFDKEVLLAWRDERLSFGQAMELLGVSKATLHRWVVQGKLRPLDDMGGTQRWFARLEVEALAEQRASS